MGCSGVIEANAEAVSDASDDVVAELFVRVSLKDHPWTPKLLALDQCIPRGGIDLYPPLCEVTTPFI